VHRVQGKAELVTDLLELLAAFHQEKLTMMLRHQAAARVAGQYDVNNTYQYIIAREDVELSWLAQAIAELGGTPASQTDAGRTVSGKGAAAMRSVLEEDANDAQAFVQRWRPRVDAMTNARHRGMLRVILGEMLEQKRFFDQALAGRTDLLGRRGEQAGPAQGEVMPTRWIE
jgi:hypothetical protein